GSSVSDLGRCSTVFGTTIKSPSPSSTDPSRKSMAIRPRRTRNASSSFSWACQSNISPNLATLAWESFTSPAICGSKTFLIFWSAAARRLILRGGMGSALHRGHDFLGGVVEIVGRDHIQPAFAKYLLAEFDIGAFEAHDQRHLQADFPD